MTKIRRDEDLHSSGPPPGVSPRGPDGDALKSIVRAIDLQHRGRLDEAEAVYRKLLEHNDSDPTVLINAGVLAMARGDTRIAYERLERATTIVPSNAVAHGNLGLVLIHLGRAAEAVDALDKAIVLKPDFAQAHNNRGLALAQLGQKGAARDAFARALSCAPLHVDAALNLGELANREGHAQAAEDAFDRVLARDPEHAVAHVGRAFARGLAGKLDESADELQRVAARQPALPHAWQTLGAVLNWSWRHDDAETAYRRALSLAPESREARFGIASTLLARGRYREGFEAFDQSRAGVAVPSAANALREWTGDALRGTLLLHAEQGLGDTVQFIRFATHLRNRVDRIALWLGDYWASLSPLMATVEGIDRVVTEADALTTEHPVARASVLSLPKLADVSLETLWNGPYVRAQADRLDRWRTRVAEAATTRVGLAWSVAARDDHGYVSQHKSIEPSSLAPVIAVEGATFHTLQPGASGEPAAFGPLASRIRPTGRDIGDFGDTSALIAHLDLVVTTDTAVAHVAGAMGKPVWLLERFHGCWRWRVAAERSPWYPTMRIFRQARFNDWSEPVRRVAAELATFKCRT